MVEEKVKVNNPSGLHLRPAGLLCKKAMNYKSFITLSIQEMAAEQPMPKVFSVFWEPV